MSQIQEQGGGDSSLHREFTVVCENTQQYAT